MLIWLRMSKLCPFLFEFITQSPIKMSSSPLDELFAKWLLLPKAGVISWAQLSGCLP